MFYHFLTRYVIACTSLFSCAAVIAEETDLLPVVPEGFVVEVVAKEPAVRNPCVMAFDRLGRIFVGQGPQWRAPSPESPGDHIDILIDDNQDGTIDRTKRFAEGFNCIQGLAWKGRDLWVANAPDLTIVRDLDGDDEADEYVRVYTGLGNLEHALHGLNFGPDGKLYMSKGNSKGYNRLDQLAPKAFRELWGLPSPEGAPDYTTIEVFKKGEYQKKYHTPADDWGQQGGILRCDPDGRNLEIVSRGFRNPWDITFDDGFDWLGTDNDQTHGDKIFAPFHGAHFGWGHPWSYHWTGVGHLPTVPASSPLFEGSGSGVIHYHAKHFPVEYQNVFFVNDWMRREVYLFRPQWDGALMRAKGKSPTVFAHAEGGRSLPSSSGRVFDPTDIEVGPDGALYILSWGHAYGATIKAGKQVDVGRVYRIRYKTNPLIEWKQKHRLKPLAEWSHDELFEDLASHLPAWRTDAQAEFIRRGVESQSYLLARLNEGHLTRAEQTWALWTLGRLSPDDPSIEQFLSALAGNANASENMRIQALRILAFRVRQFGKQRQLPNIVKEQLSVTQPRLRHEVVQAIWQANQTQWVPQLLDQLKREKDRVIFYSLWNALRELSSPEARKAWIDNSHANVRLGALLGLFQDDAITAEEVFAYRTDHDKRVSDLVESWLVKTGSAKPLVEMSPPPGEYHEPISVSLKTLIPGGVLTYTLDGSSPVNTSTRYRGSIKIDQTMTLKVAVAQENTQAGRISSGKYRIRHIPPYEHRAFISDIKVNSGHPYSIDWRGLMIGKRHYTDRDYRVTQVPVELRGMPFLQTANHDDRSSGMGWLKMTSAEEVSVLVGVDVRCTSPLAWMKIGQIDGFEETGLEVKTTDAVFRFYRKRFSAGQIQLGGNTNHPESDSRRGNYIVLFERQLLPSTPVAKSVTADDVLALMGSADSERGRELFLHPRGAGCVKCHQMEGRGSVLAPDLSDIGSRAKTPQVLIESIIKPSAVITEGFAQQQIATVNGKVYSGAVLEESGRSLKLVNSKGEVTTILKAEIEERVGTKVSPMPAGFEKLMTAQQIADLVSWLMTQKIAGDRKGFSFIDQPNQLEINFGKQRIATYLKKSKKLTRRALVNVKTHRGIQVTRNFPPRRPDDIDPGYSGEQGIIHPIIHPGIWIGFGDVDGNDYWRLKADVVFDGFIKPPTGTKKSGNFIVRNLYKSEDQSHLVCSEITKYHFDRVPAGILLRIDATFQSDQRDFYFGDQEESGLAVRVASPLRVQGGNGSILNDQGKKNAAAMWGKEAKWFDYSGIIGDRQVGLMVVPNPKNFRPSWLHARDYGIVVTNPFPKQLRERKEPYIKTWVKKGEPLHLSYAVLIHDLPVEKPLDRTAIYSEILEYLK
ncbi:PVC-type heme-binding CxxCH protein [Gimesia aquarii]|uniref:Cytochrome c n=1 Tax=Gimesia aquarii TaxID=2527964 RepID=A0A517W031_9PLAN|nr:PVC-type heme-binding CxxCH protein [Gimesia aquarii]QDT98606.1 Cytochrome c [Gimesia aquarii]